MGVKLGRTTSAFSDEDSSFYLWKWFVRQRKIKKLIKRKRKKRRFRRHDMGDEQMWYFSFMTRKVGGAYLYAMPGGSYPPRAISELQNRRQAHYIFTGERMEVLRSLFPKLRKLVKVRRRRRYRSRRLNADVLKDMHSDMSKTL